MKKKIELSSVKQIEDYSIKDDMDTFITEYKVRGMSKSTIDNYKFILSGFIKFIGNKKTKEITKNDINKFVVYCREVRNNSNTSIADKIKCLKVFFKFFQHDLQYPIVKRENSFKTPYTEEEIKTLLEKPKINSYTQWRNRAVIATLIGTGIRCNTLINLKIHDVDFVNNTIFLETTKTKKQYYLPMSSQLKQILKHYLSLYEHKEGDYLFVNQYGKQLNRTSLKQTITNYNHMRGVTKTSLHLFRHTFAIEYLRNGGNIMYLKEILGHTKLSTTQIYLQVSNTDLQTNFDNLCPLDNVKKKGIKLKKK